MIDRAHHISTNICHFVSHPFTSTKKKIHTDITDSIQIQLSQLDSPKRPTITANISWPLLSSIPSASIPSNPAHSQASRAGYCTLKVTHKHTHNGPGRSSRQHPHSRNDLLPQPVKIVSRTSRSRLFNSSVWGYKTHPDRRHQSILAPKPTYLPVREDPSSLPRRPNEQGASQPRQPAQTWPASQPNTPRWPST